MSDKRRVILVVGAASGMGAGIARDLAGSCEVCLADRNAAGAEGVKRDIGSQAHAFQLDVASPAQVREVVGQIGRQFGRLDALVNCAGYTKTLTTKTPVEEAERIFDEIVAVNLKGAYLLAATAAPLLSRPGGRIVNISSISAYIGGHKPGSLAYAAAKAGVVGMTYALARELSPEGITVNAIAPGMVGGTDFVGSAGNSDERTQHILAQTPAGRIGTVDDIVAAARYLVSPEASFVTGQVLHVNGGWLFR